MSKVIKVDVLKEILKDILPVDEKGTAAIENIMSKAEDFDEDAVTARINEATEKAKAEAASEYNQKLHDAFFKPAAETNVNDADQHVDNAPTKSEPIEIFDIVE